VNFFYGSPVGHFVEALRHCLGYYEADRSRRIGLAVDRAAPFELARLGRFVADVYPVDFPFAALGDDPDIQPDLRAIPAEWDWVVGDPRRYSQRFAGMNRYYETCDACLLARGGHNPIGVEPPTYRPHQRLRFALPQDVLDRAVARLPRGPQVAVLPAGSGPRLAYPSISSWELILRKVVSDTGAHHPLGGQDQG
jgi:hypothetical protein